MIGVMIMNEKKFAELIGLSCEEAFKILEKQEVLHRVTARNGERRPVTMDLRMDRVNLELEDDIVTKITFG